MKKTIIVGSVAMCAAAFLSTHINDQQVYENPNLLENIEALADIEEIDGKKYIVDEIPCSSGGLEIHIDYTYTNCNTCKSEKGRADGPSGTCTNIRELGILPN